MFGPFGNGQQPIYRGGLFDSGGGGTQTSTSTSSSEPWAKLQPYLEQLFGTAGGLADIPGEFPPFSTVVGFAPETEAAFSGLTDRALYGSPVVGNAGAQLSRTLGGDYLGGAPGVGAALAPALTGPNNPATFGYNTGVDELRQIAGGGFMNRGGNAGASTLTNVASGMLRGGDPTGREALLSTARGDRFGANPELDAVIARTLSDITPKVSGAFASGGRYGSGAHARALSGALADAASGIRYQDYGVERGHQLGAARDLINLGNTELGTRLGASGALLDQESRDLAARMGAAEGLIGNYQTGIGQRLGAANLLQGAFDAERQRQLGAAGMAPGIAGEDYRDLTALLGVGQAREGLEGRLGAEQLARYQFPQTEPWERARMFAELISPGLRYGTSTSTGTGTTSAPESNPLMTILGLGLAGASVAGGLGWNPFVKTPSPTLPVGGVHGPLQPWNMFG
jgi:hypothetical protein